MKITEHGLNIARIMNVFAETWFSHNSHSQCFGNMNQSVNKVLQILRFNRLLRSKTGNRPVSNSCRLIQLFVPHVPYTFLIDKIIRKQNMNYLKIIKAAHYRPSSTNRMCMGVPGKYYVKKMDAPSL